MPTALADPPAAPTEQQQPAAGAPGGAVQPAPVEPRVGARSCAKCSAPLVAGQDWCLQCGTGAPDSLRTRTPTWRSAAVILTTLAILVAGAAGAAYAALSKGGGKAAPAATTVAQVSVPATTPAPTTTPLPPAVTGTTPTPTICVPTTIKPSTPPKIPLSAPTHAPPIPAVTPSPEAGGSAPTTSKQKAPSPSTPVGDANNAEALLLDTNAAATYNPYNYAAANFGDPSLAIDGDSSTGWTALVEPSVAPKMAEGLVIDLNTPRKLAAVGLSTTTPGMTVQVYGADGEAPPSSITDPDWVALTPALQAKKKHARIKLGGSTPASKQAAKQAHRFIVLWISQAPASAVGTATAPGHVSVNELQLFPAKKK
ncbi:MAG: hypothetical protein ACHQHO_13615 [Solirubrobacterales bacterium]